VKNAPDFIPSRVELFALCQGGGTCMEFGESWRDRIPPAQVLAILMPRLRVPPIPIRRYLLTLQILVTGAARDSLNFQIHYKIPEITHGVGSHTT
jgi:hypothetical protein